MAKQQHPSYTLIANIRNVVNSRNKAIEKISGIIFLLCNGDREKYIKVIEIIKEKKDGNIS